MALTGELISAQDAYRFGLVNQVVPLRYLREETEKLAQLIAGKSAQAIATGKRAFYEQIDMPVEEAFAYATREMIAGTRTDDAKEGSRAFFEKRPPAWAVP